MITPLWDTKTDETEIAWELAVKLKERGFSNIYNYYSKAFCDPETGNCPTNAAEFAEIAVKYDDGARVEWEERQAGHRPRQLAQLLLEGVLQFQEDGLQEALGQLRGRIPASSSSSPKV